MDFRRCSARVTKTADFFHVRWDALRLLLDLVALALWLAASGLFWWPSAPAAHASGGRWHRRVRIQGRASSKGVAWNGHRALAWSREWSNFPILRSQATALIWPDLHDPSRDKTFSLRRHVKRTIFCKFLNMDPRSPRSAPQRPVTSPNGRSRCARIGKNGLCC